MYRRILRGLTVLGLPTHVRCFLGSRRSYWINVKKTSLPFLLENTPNLISLWNLSHFVSKVGLHNKEYHWKIRKVSKSQPVILWFVWLGRDKHTFGADGFRCFDIYSLAATLMKHVCAIRLALSPSCKLDVWSWVDMWVDKGFTRMKNAWGRDMGR